MLEAPKKPWTPGIRASASPTFSGSSNGPPWQMHEDVLADRATGLGDRHDPVDRLVERQRDAGADRPGRGQADVRHQLVGARPSPWPSRRRR